MTGETERTPERTRLTGNEGAMVPSGGPSHNGLSQADVVIPATGDEPVRRTGGGIGVYLHAFRRQWPLAITLGLVCGAAAAIAAWFLTSERHTAVALLQVSATEKQLVFQTAERGTTNDFEIYKGTQQQLLTSDVVLIAALRSPRRRA